MLIFSFISLGIFLYNGAVNRQTGVVPSESICYYYTSTNQSFRIYYSSRLSISRICTLDRESSLSSILLIALIATDKAISLAIIINKYITIIPNIAVIHYYFLNEVTVLSMVLVIGLVCLLCFFPSPLPTIRFSLTPPMVTCGPRWDCSPRAYKSSIGLQHFAAGVVLM